ncbi:AtpZ/AtpI family protein [Nonomuraea terrae]|uniref:AtpZ/AtpI family protein n=1 Tax=Nonomuraea terrae TaxID=2530383 RepID=A0A4V2YL08_9ACTN|nr:AtpZ/AtpI family protein [Nonomuraea terrae]TDD44517.1 AtpZ/AtpI family protein [Nonomuraea terrae]
MSEKKDRPNEDDGRNFPDDAWSIISTLLSGILIYGGIGWLLDRWLDTVAFFPIGAVVGVLLAVYLVYRKLGG